MRAWPRNLSGQLALLVAIALFVAQAINFAMLLHERQSLRLEQITGPAATRIIDAIDRNTPGRAPANRHNRLRRMASNPIPTGPSAEPEVATSLRGALAEAGVHVGRIVTARRPLSPRDPLLRAYRGRAPQYLAHGADELVIAVEQPGNGWLVQRLPWPRDNGWIIWRLVGQTLILYTVVLLPLLWAGRRISRPLADLTHAAERFAPGGVDQAVAVRGPSDVAATIAAFNALRLRVTAMLDEKDRMLGALAHDLRTPLAALRVRIESVEDDTDRARMADTIAEMNRTLDDILSLARLGRPSEPPIDTDLAALVDAVVEDFRDLGADVSFAGAARLPIRLRPTLMRRAIRNLIENAVKYGHRATVRLEPAAATVTIVVSDVGPGIAPERLDEVFDAFTRLETSRNRDSGGIGLGLALARGIVRDGGGDIVLRNRDGGGLDAAITLPR